MTTHGLWRRLDAPGHDAAFVAAEGDGWMLRGMTVFGHGAGAACVAYEVALDGDWSTRWGDVRGHREGQLFRYRIERRPDGWYLDGRRQAGLEAAVDLDFGFTPATNLQQMRRAVFGGGAVVELPVAWFDLGMERLDLLPQRYERRDEKRFWYEAPTAGYRGLLELADSGFIAHYPGLWALC
jgi:hypothetical protein